MRRKLQIPFSPRRVRFMATDRSRRIQYHYNYRSRPRAPQAITVPGATLANNESKAQSTRPWASQRLQACAEKVTSDIMKLLTLQQRLRDASRPTCDPAAVRCLAVAPPLRLLRCISLCCECHGCDCHGSSSSPHLDPCSDHLQTCSRRALAVPCRAVATVPPSKPTPTQQSPPLPKLDGTLPWLGAFGRYDIFTLCEC
jgi:hypothetical protein